MTYRKITMAAIAVLGLVIPPAAKAADKGCSNATLKGTFTHMGFGFQTPSATTSTPFGGLGTQFFDGNGGVTGETIGSNNGTIFGGSFKGTYTVNSDCTGIITVQRPNGTIAKTYFVLIWTNTDTGTTLSEFQFFSMDAGIVEPGIARRQFPVGDVRN